jgi:hypothetical protein
MAPARVVKVIDAGMGYPERGHGRGAAAVSGRGSQLLLVHTPLHSVALRPHVVLRPGAVGRQKARHLPQVGGGLPHVDQDDGIEGLCRSRGSW